MYNNISLYFSSDCNMSCQYCEINKHKSCMSENNRDIRKKIESGEYAQNVIHKLGRLSMSEISLWGMEPTINADMFSKLIEPLLDHFVDVRTIMFSTNSWLGWDRLKLFILSLHQYNNKSGRSVRLNLQISLDGDVWLNDRSRRNGTTQNTLLTVRQIIENTPKNLNYELHIHTKPTLDVEYMRVLNSDRDKLFAHYKFFDDLQTEMVALNTNKNITLDLAQCPTLVNPGHHTVEDGRTFAEFIKNVRNIDASKFTHMKHPLLLQPLRGLREAMVITNHNEFSHWGACSAGRYTANIDCNGNLFSCHALFSRGYMDRLSSISDAHTTVNDGNFERLQYVDLLWQEYPESRFKFCEIIIKALASYGQIDKIFLSDNRMTKLLFYALGGVYCQYGHVETTKSIWAYTTSQFKYFGNGALQQILRYMKECGIIDDI